MQRRSFCSSLSFKKKHVKAPVEKLVGADINNFNLKKDRRNNKLLWFKGKLNDRLFDLLLDCGASTCCIAKRCATTNHVLKKNTEITI